jgi:FdhE protein
MNSSGEDFRKIESSLDSLNGKEYISEHTVRFFKNITKAHGKVKSQLKQEEIPWHLTENEIKDRIHQGKPLISFNSLPLRETLLKDLFLEICNIIKDHQNSNQQMVQILIGAEEGKKLSLPLMVEKLLYHDQACFQTAAEKLAVDADLLLFIALNLAKPFCEVAAQRITFTIGENEWLRHYCPVCGGAAQLARLEKEAGKKILYCQLCGTEWRYLRIKCPFCCNEKQKSMSFLQVENSPYRLDFCDQCKRYIKTFDERKGGGGRGVFLPSVEDLATMYLDFLAEREGYSRSCFFPPPVDTKKVKATEKTLH